MQCWVREAMDGRTEFAGKLLEVSPGRALTLEETVGTRREIPRRW